ncbi:MAG: zf-TFIIB domain-containing protein [Fibrobacter sp.]|jgi:Zn-finger nucleic acid-binding protein|nr:zf-TFIIB domain-containing protein [Fibrobacter sp.]
MRCEHCGANLKHAIPVCEYCGTHNDIDLSGRHYYTTHASGQARTCPECKEPMSVIDVGVAGKPFFLDRCDRCLGLFFDAGELDTLLSESIQGINTLNHVRLGELKKSPPAEREKITYRPCPVCGKLMNRQNYGGTSGVIADSCRDHGVYLDAGELYRLFHWRRAGGHLQELPKEEERKKKKKKEPMPFLMTEEPSYENRKTISLGSLLIDFVMYLLKR